MMKTKILTLLSIVFISISCNNGGIQPHFAPNSQGKHPPEEPMLLQPDALDMFLAGIDPEVWSSLDRLLVYAQSDEQDALIDLKGHCDAENYGCTFIPNQGFLGDSLSYLETNYLPDGSGNYKMDNAFYVVYVLKAPEFGEFKYVFTGGQTPEQHPVFGQLGDVSLLLFRHGIFDDLRGVINSTGTYEGYSTIIKEDSMLLGVITAPSPVGTVYNLIIDGEIYDSPFSTHTVNAMPYHSVIELGYKGPDGEFLTKENSSTVPPRNSGSDYLLSMSMAGAALTQEQLIKIKTDFENYLSQIN